MIGTYVAAALICAASLLVGRALLALGRRDRWSWLEPAVGLAALFTVAGLFARAPGHATTAAIAMLLLMGGALLAARSRPYRGAGSLGVAVAVGLLVVAAISIPFAVNERYGLLGVGFNNDLGLHLAWSEWLREGLGPEPDDGYPLGPHGLSTTIAMFTGIELSEAFTGLLIAISVLTGLTALAALPDLSPRRRVAAAVLVALPYLAASYVAQSAFKETGQALFVLAFAIALADAWPFPTARRERLLAGLPFAVLAAGIVFSYSFIGLAWPLAALAVWSLTLPQVRRALGPRRLLRAAVSRTGLIALAGLGVAVLVFGFVGPFGFADSFSDIQGSDTYGPVSPAEALGFWAAANYRELAPGGPDFPVLTTIVAGVALLGGLAWWLRRREPAVPAALAGGTLIYVGSLPFSGDYAQAKALMIVSPLVMLIAVRALLDEPLPRVPAPAWLALGVVFWAGAAYSSFLALRDAPVAPPGHGAELAEFRPEVGGSSVLYAGQDRFAAYGLRGADTGVPVVEFPDPAVEERPTKPFDTGISYSPVDFDSFKPGTLDRFDYVVTTAAAYASEAPANFEEVERTPSYVLWERTGETSRERKTLLEGGAPAAPVDCREPEKRLFVAKPGQAAVMPTPVIGPKDRWDEGPIVALGERTSQTLALPAGSWEISLQYFSPEPLTLRFGKEEVSLPAALDGQRPNLLRLFNDGQYWPAGSLEQAVAGPLRFTIEAGEASGLGRLLGYDGKAYLGEVVATRAEPRSVMALSEICGRWVDWYEGDGVWP